MNTPRFDRNSQLCPSSRTWPKRIHITGDAGNSGSARTFAIVTASFEDRSSEPGTRRILIFDNHPATLKLLRDVTQAERQQVNPKYVALGMILLVAISLGMIWPLLRL